MQKQTINYQNIVVPEDGVGCGGDGSVSGFCNASGLNLVSVTLVDDLLHGGWHQDVALFVQQLVLALDDGLSSGEAPKT